MIRCSILSYEKSIELVSTSDDYTQSVGKSPFVLDQIFNKKNATEQDYLTLCSKSIQKDQIDFAQKDSKIKKTIDLYTQRLNDFFISNNIEIDLDFFIIIGSGIESYGMPYTRQNAVIHTSPGSILSSYLFFHEFFHILSRKYPLLRDTVFSTFGFINANKQLLDVSQIPILVNPDAVDYTFYINSRLESGETVPVVPFISAKASTLSRFALAKLNQDLSVNSLIEITETNYGHEINTGYIAHPEEISADNFSYFFLKDQNDQLNQQFKTNLLSFFKLNR